MRTFLAAIFLACLIATNGVRGDPLLTEAPDLPKIEQSGHDDIAAYPQQSGTYQNADPNQFPLLVKILKSPDTDEEAERNRQKEIDEASDRWWTKAIGISAAVIGLLQFFVYLYQGYWLRRTVRTMDDTALRQLRAYVWCTATQLHDLEIGKLPRAVMEIRNAGQTPAYDMQVYGGIVLLPYPLPDDTAFPILTAHKSTKMVLHPGGGNPHYSIAEFSSGGIKTMDTKHLDAVRKGEDIRIYLAGLISYRDAFSKARETRFLFSVKILDDLGSPKGLHVTFQGTQQHNTAT